VRDEGGGVAVNPFANPTRIMVQARPQDMRAGIYRLATVVEAELGCRPDDGTLWCFVSRDRRKAKMIRYDGGAWCLWYVRLAEGSIRWERDASGAPTLAIDRSQLVCLLAGAPVAERWAR